MTVVMWGVEIVQLVTRVETLHENQEDVAEPGCSAESRTWAARSTKTFGSAVAPDFIMFASTRFVMQSSLRCNIVQSTAMLCRADFISIVGEEKVNASTNSLALDLVDGLGETTNVLAGDAGNGDTAVLGGVDRVLMSKLVR